VGKLTLGEKWSNQAGRGLWMKRCNTRARSFWIHLAFGLLILAGAPVSSEVWAQPQKWAVVIGIGQYKDTAIRPLRYAGADAKAVYAFLVDPKGGGFPKGNVQLLLDAQATQVALRSALGTTLARRAVGGDTVFIYYAGHGAPETDLANREPDGYAKYLVPHDADAKDLFATAINMAEVETFFSRIKADTVILALDTCYSGAGGGRGFANLPPGGRDITLKGDFLTRLAQGKGRAILTAADTNEVALELPDLGHGLFTYHLLEGLRGKADTQGKGYVTLQDAYRYVYDRVARHSRQVGGNQNPKLMAQAVGEIVLAGRMPPVAVVPPPKPTVREEIRQEVGVLALSSKVPGVEVWVGQDRIGETKQAVALIVGNLAVGSHRVKAQKQGYKAWEREVQVAANQRSEVLVDLDPLGPSPVIKGDDGAEMVLVPAGEFWMGSTREEVDRVIEECKKAGQPEASCKDWNERELPQRRVTLDAFYIDRYEVTNALFARFVTAQGYRTTAEREGHGWAWQQKDGKWQWMKVDGAAWRTPNGLGTSAPSNHPVVQVSWHDVEAYCKWAGKRLPTEAEWEKAARGTDGRRYPWSETWDPAKANGDMTVKTTTPVGSYPRGVSPYGVHDMAGNVWEWVQDWYGPYPSGTVRNPSGPTSGQWRVVRGGSWGSDPRHLRSADRSWPDPSYRDGSRGFRCAQSP